MSFDFHARRPLSVAVAVALGIVLASSADAQYKKQGKRAEKQMSGVISSVESSGGMMTVRLDNGDVFSAPVQKVRVRDGRQSDAQSRKVDVDAKSKTAPRTARLLEATPDSLKAGTRVVVRRKLDKDGNVKRVVVRIVEQQ